MSRGRLRSSVGGVTSNRRLRIGAAAAFSSGVLQVVTVPLIPDWEGDPDDAAIVVAGSGVWTVQWLMHATWILLAVAALSVVTRTFDSGVGKEWARVGLPLFVIAGALGVAEVLLGAGLRDLADSAVAATPEAKPAYLAAFDATRTAATGIDFAALLALAMYLVTLAAAILGGSVYARWLGWTSAVAGSLVIGGILVELRWHAAQFVVAGGNLLFVVVLVGLGVSMWRDARSSCAVMRSLLEVET